ncbi:indolepyruvate ferredoxin oxidoreductase subunit alpha [candidate division WOR-3 bacterium]|nr:indolepyruvate ferredoxin oxidoreductase subunit alpha [candidate division WOR-3 bacterium]
MNSELLLGDEAVARGAWEAGCSVAAAYPGTPSTEILEALARYQDVYCEWSVNEKVALEVALGAAHAGVRSLAAMKHVGLNVAADPLFSAAYIGVNAGLVIVTADDPGLHSSQNEQDNRFYALAAKIPLLCPSDSQEAKDFTKLAFDLSEEYDIPVLLRLTTRIAHSCSIVTLEPRIDKKPRGYEKQLSKTTLLPVFARVRHIDLEKRLVRLQDYAEKSPLNRVELGNANLGIICDGVAYQYAREVFPDASFLKLGLVYPFPRNLVLNFAQKVKELIVIEEVDPFIELQTRALGLQVKGKDQLPRWGELNSGIIRTALADKKVEKSQPEEEIPNRPPALCPGCPHLGLFYALQKQKAIIAGDIGCYTLGALPPHSAMDTCIDMGASITFAHGADKALGKSDPRPRIALLGDSTFFHSGITGLINTTYNKSNVITIITDNRTTGMTGHQDHPGTGKTLKGEQTQPIDLELLCRACGVEQVIRVDPYHPQETKKTIQNLLKENKRAVVISQRACALLVGKQGDPKKVNKEKCIGCRACLALGCPAISFADNKAFIIATACTGCAMCVEICPKEAIE